DAEDCRARSNPERERQDGNDGERWALAQHAQAVTQILHEGCHDFLLIRTLVRPADRPSWPAAPVSSLRPKPQQRATWLRLPGSLDHTDPRHKAGSTPDAKAQSTQPD